MQIQKITTTIKELEAMKNYPKELFYLGNRALLNRPKVSIVGTRRPSAYTKKMTHLIAQHLSQRGVVTVSGAAMGVDALAHIGAGVSNTIAVVANSLDIRYPAVNRDLIASIEKDGLVLSQFPTPFKARAWSFVVRNELVVALGDILVVTQADLNSGSLRSVEYALAMGKEIHVLPHHIDESLGTNQLLEAGLAKPIYDIEKFANRFGNVPSNQTIERDEFFYFCQNSPTLDEAIERFSARVYEAELEGIIRIENGLVHLA